MPNIIPDGVSLGSQRSCFCEHCRGACETKPGWFLPGEAERLADLLGYSLKTLFERSLMIDYWEESPQNIYLLSPTIVGWPAGRKAPEVAIGRCVFFEDGHCRIHDFKPYECAQYLHSDSNIAISVRHAFVAHQWRNEQGRLAPLLRIAEKNRNQIQLERIRLAKQCPLMPMPNHVNCRCTIQLASDAARDKILSGVMSGMSKNSGNA